MTARGSLRQVSFVYSVPSIFTWNWRELFITYRTNLNIVLYKYLHESELIFAFHINIFQKSRALLDDKITFANSFVRLE